MNETGYTSPIATTAIDNLDLRKQEIDEEIEEILKDEPLVAEDDWVPSYKPTRTEYFAARALQALLTSLSEKKHDQAAVQAVVIAKQIEIVLDKAQG